MEKEKNRAIVTGSSSGIGFGIVKKYLKEGWEVIGVDLQAPLMEIESEVFLYKKIDITNEGEVKNLFETGIEVSSIDTIINCAGTIEDTIEINILTKDIFCHTLNVNLIGPFLMIKYGIPLLKKSKEASIINIGSISGTKKVSAYLAYSASKGGLLSLTKGLAKKLAPLGIRVNMISPGSVVNTGFFEKQYGCEISFMDKIKFLKQTPLKQLNDPDTIAEIAYFLSTQAARVITGAHIVADGGISL